MDDMASSYKKNLEQLKATRDFIRSMNPTDYKLTGIASALDAEINKTESTISALRGKAAAHRCDFCDRGYDEEPLVMIRSLNICPICRSRGKDYQLGSVLEKEYGLPAGTIKRDCLPNGDNPPRLQPFIDVGLVYKSGVHNMVHIKVIELFYNDERLYRRRKRK